MPDQDQLESALLGDDLDADLRKGPEIDAQRWDRQQDAVDAR